jgi:hypothetical protein
MLKKSLKKNIYLLLLVQISITTTTTTTATASFLNPSIRNLLAKKEIKFCPKKHYIANQSCFMYFLIEETFPLSFKYCKNFSNNLVIIENESKWQDLKNQLNMFKLFNNKFKIGLQVSQQSGKWSWSNGMIYNKKTISLKFCNQTEPTTTITQTPKISCSYLTSTSKTDWCIKKISCNNKTKFICEWNLSNYKTYNSSLSISLRYTFLTLFLISSIVLITLLFLLYNFIIKSRYYLVLYCKDNKFNLAYKKFTEKIKSK